MMDKKFSIYFSLLHFLSLSLFFLEPAHIDAGKGGGKADAHITFTKQKLRSSFFFYLFLFLFFLLINKTKN